jgi:DNA-binding XRE family transcriptional regulator
MPRKNPIHPQEIEIGRRVREVRGMDLRSRSEFASILNITKERIISYEMGRVPLPLKVGASVCSQFNISLLWLGMGYGPRSPYVLWPSLSARWHDINDMSLSHFSSLFQAGLPNDALFHRYESLLGSDTAVESNKYSAQGAEAVFSGFPPSILEKQARLRSIEDLLHHVSLVIGIENYDTLVGNLEKEILEGMVSILKKEGLPQSDGQAILHELIRTCKPWMAEEALPVPDFPR